MFPMKIRNICLGLALGALATGAAWATDAGAADKASTNKAGTTKATAAKGAGEVAVLETSKGKMVVEFWEKDAPQTVANFKKLARQGYYDGTGFHRIIKGFMIQGGDPKSKNPNAPDLGTGNPGYSVNDEFNAHKHVKGVISMANSGTPNSAGSQFFIMHAPSPSLDGKYTAFGRLISGMDVLDKIANSQTGPNPSMPGENSKPLEWTTLKSVKITSRALALGGAKKAEASRPAATKPAEVKAGMGAGAGMNMGAGEAKPASEAKPVEAKPAETQTPPAEATQPPAEKPAGEGNEPAPEGGQAK